jgi:hypothetical protein
MTWILSLWLYPFQTERDLGLLYLCSQLLELPMNVRLAIKPQTSKELWLSRYPGYAKHILDASDRGIEPGNRRGLESAAV